MKIVFISNFLNHHQIPLSEEFVRQGVDYTFVSCCGVPQERISGGYSDFSKSKYNINLGSNNFELICDLVKSADAVIFGSGDKRFIDVCVDNNKLLFLYLEHSHKKRIPKLIHDFSRRLKYRKLSNYKKCYILCASSHTKSEFERIHCFKNKFLYWGYFPKPDASNISFGEKTYDFLWCGRLLKWKQPSHFVWLASKVGRTYSFDLYGSGSECANIKRFINRCKLKNVMIHEPVPYSDVEKIMSRSKYYIFSSNNHEGWGAVLNESMCSGCIVFANSSAGSTSFLIKNGVNGFVYNNKKELLEIVKNIIGMKPDKLKQISNNARDTILNKWNAKNAVSNLLTNVDKILNQKEPLQSNTPEPGLFYKTSIIEDAKV